MRIAFIGLGVMGAPMAANLIAAGHELMLHRVTEGRHDHLVEAGGTPTASPAEAAIGSDVIVMMLPDTPDVEHVLFGESGVIEGLEVGSTVLDMSSISPTATLDFAERVNVAGGRYVDAPVSGGEVGAEAGTLSIMVGGAETDVALVRPLLEVMGSTISRIGGVGAGQTAKVANQMVVGITLAAVAEALTFAEAAGADASKVREALMGGFASSRILELHGQRMIDRNFEPGFRARLHRKDLNLATAAGAELGLFLPATTLAQQLMTATVARGAAERDHSAVVETIRALGALND